MICCFTGHRHFDWDDGKYELHYKDLLSKLEQAIDFAIEKGVTHFICGNAVGVDTWAAELVLKKKEAYPEIFLEIAIPFLDHNADIEDCQNVQKRADLVHVVSKAKDRKSAFNERNRYMVDKSDMLIGVYSPSHLRGGTMKTIEYAEKKGLFVIKIIVLSSKNNVRKSVVIRMQEPEYALYSDIFGKNLNLINDVDKLVKLRNAFLDAFDSLSPDERAVIWYKYGFDDCIQHSDTEVSRHYNISQEDTSEFLSSALRMLRHPSCSMPIRRSIT